MTECLTCRDVQHSNVVHSFLGCEMVLAIITLKSNWPDDGINNVLVHFTKAVNEDSVECFEHLFLWEICLWEGIIGNGFSYKIMIF